MSFSDAPISFPGLFGDWQFTVPSKALNIGNGIYWYGIIIAAGMLLGLYFCMKQAHEIRPDRGQCHRHGALGHPVFHHRCAHLLCALLP